MGAVPYAPTMLGPLIRAETPTYVSSCKSNYLYSSRPISLYVDTKWQLRAVFVGYGLTSGSLPILVGST